MLWYEIWGEGGLLWLVRVGDDVSVKVEGRRGGTTRGRRVANIRLVARVSRGRGACGSLLRRGLKQRPFRGLGGECLRWWRVGRWRWEGDSGAFVGVLVFIAVGWRSRGQVVVWRRRQPRASNDEVPELREGYPLLWVAFEHSSQDHVQLWWQGQDGAEELGVLEEGPEGGILGGCLFPRIAATSQVDENDS